MERIAVIGAGIAGMAAAHTLVQAPHARHITLLEASNHFGGHANTVDVTLDGVTHGVDTGFLVYNERTYPGLIQLFSELGVPTVASDMSFSVQARNDGLTWSGTSLATVFAQKRNLLKADFWRMLRDILRFNRLATELAEQSDSPQPQQTTEAFLTTHGFSRAFQDWYLLPMIACIWSCPRERMLAFPIASLIRFCHNHGLLQVTQRPQWFTVRGGSREYVRRLIARLPDARLNTPVMSVRRLPSGALVQTEGGSEHFDQVIFACHPDQTLRLLGDDASVGERKVLGAIRYQPNRAVLHTDASLLPEQRAAWAAWNYETGGTDTREAVCLHYWINQLQPLPWQQPVIVSLNPLREPEPTQVIQTFEYDHPVFDAAALAAQQRLSALQGLRGTWYCGAWTGYGFHEDGLRSGQLVANALMQTEDAPWQDAA
ncbi:FAD-dependent oxidoreductase [Hydrogenophaga sp. PAMC20947]|uniref:NAD(P)/FAD-dependent oxidoreductase n=1 Tax=Hydrogenophaga sp. PAMC20947 TaxID=2565558 RepID=UPI00109DA0D9|nr:FAD-dependent oxidoreductase [Hydrogenophaga sp. PAMC20947]QCB47289.1 FAD-dependent oxidoreductase [Hydrogenophaga sp. PAMC20947]